MNITNRYTALIILLTVMLCELAGVNSARAEDSGRVVITLHNDDRLSGCVVTVTADRLLIETPYAGQVSIRIADIKAGQTTDDKLRERLVALLPSMEKAQGAEAKKATPAPAQNAERAESWKRSVDFAYTLARGNANTSDLYATFSLSRHRGSNRLAFASLGRYGVSNGAQVTHLFSSLFRYEQPVATVPAFTETTFEIDGIKRLNYRLSENVGLTYPVRKSEDSKLNFDLGMGLSHEAYSTGLERTLASGLLRATGVQKLLGKTRLSQQVSLFPDLSGQAGYRLQADVSFTAPITNHIGLRLRGLNRFDSRPQGTAKRNDFSLLTGFTFEF